MSMMIAGFMPESFVDWRGRMVATIFTYGCNFRCPFCHNYTLVTKTLEMSISPENILNRVMELKDWIDGVCITGGEPTIHPDLPEFVRELSKIVPVKLDTNGSNPKVLRDLMPYVDYVAMDIKAPMERYRELAGTSVDIDKIDESIRLIMREARDYEFRTTAVPILSDKDFESISAWIRGAKRYVIQQYSTDGGTLDPKFLELRPHDSTFLSSVCNRISVNFRECIVVNI